MQVREGALVLGGQTGQVVTNFLGSETYTSKVEVWGESINTARNVPTAIGRLEGWGTIGGLAVDKNAVVSPGTSDSRIGTIVVKGQAQFATGSLYDVDIASNGASDRLVVETLKQSSGFCRQRAT